MPRCEGHGSSGRTSRGQKSTHDLAVHLDGTVDTELPGLSRTAGKHGPKNGDIQSSLHGSKSHLHVRSGDARIDAAAVPIGPLVSPRPSAGGQFGAIILGHVFGVHVDDAQEPAAEHALPLALDDVLAVVGAQHTLGKPFLLEEGWGSFEADLGVFHLGDVEEIVFVP